MSVKFHLQKKSFCAIGGGGPRGGGGNVYDFMVVPKKLLQDHLDDTLSVSADATNTRPTPNQQLMRFLPRFPDIPRACHVRPSLVAKNFLYTLSLSQYNQTTLP